MGFEHFERESLSKKQVARAVGVEDGLCAGGVRRARAAGGRALRRRSRRRDQKGLGYSERVFGAVFLISESFGLLLELSSDFFGDGDGVRGPRSETQ